MTTPICGVFSTIDGKLVQCTFPGGHSLFHSWRIRRELKCSECGITEARSNEFYGADEPLSQLPDGTIVCAGCYDNNHTV